MLWGKSQNFYPLLFSFHAIFSISCRCLITRGAQRGLYYGQGLSRRDTTSKTIWMFNRHHIRRQTIRNLLLKIRGFDAGEAREGLNGLGMVMSASLHHWKTTNHAWKPEFQSRYVVASKPWKSMLQIYPAELGLLPYVWWGNSPSHACRGVSPLSTFQNLWKRENEEILPSLIRTVWHWYNEDAPSVHGASLLAIITYDEKLRMLWLT